MTRSDARMIAEELFKLLEPVIIRQLSQTTSEALDKVLSTKEAAEYLGVKPKTIYNSISEIPHFKSGGKLKFSQLALDEYLRNRR